MPVALGRFLLCLPLRPALSLSHNLLKSIFNSMVNSYTSRTIMLCLDNGDKWVHIDDCKPIIMYKVSSWYHLHAYRITQFLNYLLIYLLALKLPFVILSGYLAASIDLCCVSKWHAPTLDPLANQTESGCNVLSKAMDIRTRYHVTEYFVKQLKLIGGIKFGLAAFTLYVWLNSRVISQFR